MVAGLCGKSQDDSTAWPVRSLRALVSVEDSYVPQQCTEPGPPQSLGSGSSLGQVWPQYNAQEHPKRQHVGLQPAMLASQETRATHVHSYHDHIGLFIHLGSGSISFTMEGWSLRL